MKLTVLTLGVLAAAYTAQAHFTFIVPWAGGSVAEMILSETLSAEDTVNPSIAAGAELKVRDAKGNVSDVKMEQDGHRLLMKLAARGNRIVYGKVNLGVAQRGPNPKPHLLVYYPKTILGQAFGAAATVGEPQVVELVPCGEPGRVQLQLLARGKPVPNSEFTLILPNGKSQKVKTGEDGMAGPFAMSGRYGAWARYWEDTSGEQNGKRYEQVRHYAMIVFDAYAQPPRGTPLPEKTSSFGAASAGGWLYVYGGHTARTHSYSTESVSGRFQRLRSADGSWETLPEGTPLQGLNLAAYQNKVCRVGGMAPQNKPGEKTDNRSVSEVACFDPERKAWSGLPALPEPRSSHDVVVIGDRMIVTGGWTMRGKESPVWAKTTLVLDLSRPSSGWTAVPQPFERRALVAAVHRGKVYVIGGITQPGRVSTEVDVYDPVANNWSKGPSLPGDELTGFAPAAAVHGGKLYVSAGDGSLLVLDESRQVWVEKGRSAERLAHRMVSHGESLLILGGAVKGGNLDVVEKALVP